MDAKKCQNAVRRAMLRSYYDYKENAYGKDIYSPIKRTGSNMGTKPFGWIIVDALDTLMIMGLNSEVKEARKWMESLDYTQNLDASTFETTIRMVGGLLSAYYLSQDKFYLVQAEKLTKRLLPAFNSPSGLPYPTVNLKTGHVNTNGNTLSVAEVGTLQLEFKYLAHLTNNKTYWDIAEKVLQVIHDNYPESGLAPTSLSAITGNFTSVDLRLGSRADSYYEYLIKQYMQTNFTENIYKGMYEEAAEGIATHLVGRSMPSGLAFVGELPLGLRKGELVPQMDHLCCFLGGMLALGVTQGKPVETSISAKAKWPTHKHRDWQLAQDLTETCAKMYFDMPAGLAPEIAMFRTKPIAKDAKRSEKRDFYVKRTDLHNLQRPETVESLFVLWRLTKNNVYREWGWSIFSAFEKYAFLGPGRGYTCLDNVALVPPSRRDNMESFWMSETLKYLYLLFDDTDMLPLDSIVFNTEAHPLPIFDSKFGKGWSAQNHKRRVYRT